MSGRPPAERLDGIRPGAQVLFLSAYPHAAVVRRGVLDGGTLFIGKPFTAEALLRKVREAPGAPERSQA